MTRFITTILTAVASLLWAMPVEAQERVVIPEEEDILAKTLYTASPYYYTNLMLNYRNGTEPLDQMGYYYLYYGFLYDEAYRPFAENRALNSMLEIMAGIDPEQPSVYQLQRLIECGVEAMELDPFNPKVLNMLAFAYGALGDSEREHLYYDHLTGILQAIELSGSGLKEESPWHVLMFSHAYDLLASKGMTYGEARIISRTVQFVPLLRKSAEGIKGYYFDYSRVYRNKPDEVTFKRDRTWQFNNLKPREYK